MELSNERIAFDIFKLAKKGDKQKEVDLLIILHNETKTIRYQYLSRAKKLGLSILDLENYVIHALFILFKKEYDEIDPDTFVSFFKYIYLRVIQQELRSRYRKKELAISDISELNEDPFYNINHASFETRATDDDKPNVIKNEICKELLDKNVCKLNHKEKKIIYLFTIGYNLFEQSKQLKVPNSTLYNRYKSGVDKIRAYVIKHDIFYGYDTTQQMS